MSQFKGFTKAFFRFFNELEQNNNRDWFNANKKRFQDNVQEPALEFVRAMGTRLKKISKELIADDRKVGGSMMRIYRDSAYGVVFVPEKT